MAGARRRRDRSNRTLATASDGRRAARAGIAAVRGAAGGVAARAAGHATGPAAVRATAGAAVRATARTAVRATGRAARRAPPPPPAALPPRPPDALPPSRRRPDRPCRSARRFPPGTSAS